MPRASLEPHPLLSPAQHPREAMPAMRCETRRAARRPPAHAPTAKSMQEWTRKMYESPAMATSAARQLIMKRRGVTGEEDVRLARR